MIEYFKEAMEIEEEYLLEMARIGWVPVGSTKSIEVYVHTDDGGEIPHFHVRKYGSKNKFEWETCIKFEAAEYFLHGKYRDKLPDRKTCKLLDKMLRSKDPEENGSTYWETAIKEWNRNNSDRRLSIDLEQPDYSRL